MTGSDRVPVEDADVVREREAREDVARDREALRVLALSEDLLQQSPQRRSSRCGWCGGRKRVGAATCENRQCQMDHLGGDEQEGDCGY